MYEFGRAPRPRRQPVHINEVILDTLDTFSEEVRARRIETRKTLARELHAYLLDQEAFYKAILALMLNAVENAPEGGVIEVVTYEGREGKLHVEIIDNGPGIPDDVAKRMFQPFNAGPESRGTGMGLANTKRLVEAMGGAVHVTSGKSGGTQATLIFPAALQASAAEAS
jgi:signal transduction histidine kinase